jgi:hypothetical protein
MAEEVQIQSTGVTGKLRNPLGVIGLTIITLGFYWLYWYYQLNKELAAIGEAHNTEECGTSPGTSLLAVTLGVFLIVPPFLSGYKTWERLGNAARLTGTELPFEPWIGFILSVVIGPVGTYFEQDSMNDVLQAQAGGGGAQAALPQEPQQQPAEAERQQA